MINENEWKKRRYRLFTEGIRVAKNAIESLDEVPDAVADKTDKIQAAFIIRAMPIIEYAHEFPREKRLEQIKGLWALCVAMFALGWMAAKDENSG